MEKFDYKGKIQVYGAMFDGVNDIILHALKGISKDGVYVGEESQRYPCFDSEDYASESRYYWNFVFAKSKTELKDRMQKLKAMPVIGSNFKKLNNELHPMGYWGGDTNYPVEMTTEETKAFEKVTFKEIGKLDMVIAFDTTGSMAAYIEAVRSEVADLVPRLFKENDDLRLGIVAFGDYCDMKSAHEFGDAYQCMTFVRLKIRAGVMVMNFMNWLSRKSLKRLPGVRIPHERYCLSRMRIPILWVIPMRIMWWVTR